MRAKSVQPLAAELTLTEILRLQRSRYARDQAGIFYAEGIRHLCKLQAQQIERLLISPQLLSSRAGLNQVKALQNQGVACQTLAPEMFRQLSRLERASGVAALLYQSQLNLHQQSPRQGLCWLVLERTGNAGNLGTLIRSAVAVQAAGLILLGPDSDPYDWRCLRASMGSFFHLPILHSSHRSFGDWARRHRAQVIGASPDAPQLYGKAFQKSRRPLVLMLGSERKGLSPAQLKHCTMQASLPMPGRIDSLNLAIAGSVMLYEILRQKSEASSRQKRQPRPT